MSGDQLRLPRFEPGIERLVKLPAWQRAQVYELAGLDLGERSLIELEVRTRIAREFKRQHGRGRGAV
jgi:hypothetical protein